MPISRHRCSKPQKHLFSLNNNNQHLSWPVAASCLLSHEHDETVDSMGTIFRGGGIWLLLLVITVETAFTQRNTETSRLLLTWHFIDKCYMLWIDRRSTAGRAGLTDDGGWGRFTRTARTGRMGCRWQTPRPWTTGRPPSWRSPGCRCRGWCSCGDGGDRCGSITDQWFQGLWGEGRGSFRQLIENVSFQKCVKIFHILLRL